MSRRQSSPEETRLDNRVHSFKEVINDSGTKFRERLLEALDTVRGFHLDYYDNATKDLLGTPLQTISNDLPKHIKPEELKSFRFRRAPGELHDMENYQLQVELITKANEIALIYQFPNRRWLKSTAELARTGMHLSEAEIAEHQAYENGLAEGRIGGQITVFGVRHYIAYLQPTK